MPEGRLQTAGRGAGQLFAAPWLMFVRHLPGPLGVRLRRGYWRRRLGALGDGARIDEGVKIINPADVFIGSRCWIAADVLIGPVVIEPEAFVGTQAVVLPGVTVGRRAWLGAGVIARRSIEAGRIVKPPDSG